jgi:hypothetical protein
MAALRAKTDGITTNSEMDGVTNLFKLA